ncbi:DUF3140 domain-containing protein [Spirillospora sp. NPDC047279]|uniref:DUF3140 domain-containing protein n=1 Tax=Spirillospora sp. NPDC047279 TaxID=3155478 RepID=UPI0033F5B2E6
MESIPGEAELLWEEFHQIVNMTSDELRACLLTDDAPAEDGLGLQVMEVLLKRKADLTDADTETMRQVVYFVEDRLDEEPQDDGWRRTLMSVGHDPHKT